MVRTIYHLQPYMYNGVAVCMRLSWSMVRFMHLLTSGMFYCTRCAFQPLLMMGGHGDHGHSWISEVDRSKLNTKDTSLAEHHFLREPGDRSMLYLAALLIAGRRSKRSKLEQKSHRIGKFRITVRNDFLSFDHVSSKQAAAAA